MRFLAVFGVFLWGSAAWGQGTPFTVEGELRGFGGREDLTYFGGQAEYRSWILRGIAADRKTSVLSGQNTILHGGGDLEAAYRRQLAPEWQGQLGVAYSDTAARRKKTQVTARARWEKERYFIEPRAVLSSGTLIGVAFGGSTALGSKATVTASITPILSGKNTLDSQGRLARKTLWEVGISKDRVTVGTTNALGMTTGMSLTPTIGSTGFFVKVRLTQ